MLIMSFKIKFIYFIFDKKISENVIFYITCKTTHLGIKLVQLITALSREDLLSTLDLLILTYRRCQKAKSKLIFYDLIFEG